ncbi:hypothetical protein FPQ18DRAFT_351190 [Pyronema domesticum]|nr:hypothetical protein FPQ18DRAFT_351190 [Pyronema domesticum]
MARLNSRVRAARKASKASVEAARRRRQSLAGRSEDGNYSENYLENAESPPTGNYSGNYSENYPENYPENYLENYSRNEEIPPNATPPMPLQPNPPDPLPSLADILPPYTLIPRRSIDDPNLHQSGLASTPSALQPGLPAPAPVLAERVLVDRINRRSFSWMNTPEPHHTAPLEPLYSQGGIQRQNIDMSVVKLEEPGPYDYNSRYYGSM